MGKTALATNIAENVAILSRVPVLFVSLEMARLELAQRLLSSQGSIDGNKFRSGIISADEREKLVEASGRLSQSPLYIDDTPTRTVTEIAACARRMKRKQGWAWSSSTTCSSSRRTILATRGRSRWPRWRGG